MTTIPCSICDCGKPVVAKGFCSKHWQRWRKNGDPLATRITPQGVSLKWIHDKAVQFAGDDCLFWPFGRQSDGYGTVQFERRKHLAHRVVCEFAHGKPQPADAEAAHSCGNGHLGCVNPSHLSWKTRTGNMADKVVHGTHSRGTKAHNSRLTEQDVREIRALAGKVPYRVLGERFGIAKNTARLVAIGKRWGWLDHG